MSGAALAQRELGPGGAGVPARRRRQRALSMAEVVLSSAIVGVLLVAALRTVAAAGQDRMTMERRLIARQLAQGLLAEIVPKAFADPAGGTTTLGLDAGEVASDRRTFDDVDDYSGWSASPPQGPQNNPLTTYANWSTSVQVRYVTLLPGGVASPSASPTNFKSITVTVAYQGSTVLALTTIRANY